MRIVAIAFLVLSVGACSLFQNSKKPIVEKLSVQAGKASQLVLGCTTGEAVRADVSEQLTKLFKVQSSSGQADAKGIVGDLCSYGVGLALPYLVNLGDKKLPESWIADNCSLTKVGDSVELLAKKLCAQIPI